MATVLASSVHWYVTIDQFLVSTTMNEFSRTRARLVHICRELVANDARVLASLVYFVHVLDARAVVAESERAEEIATMTPEATSCHFQGRF